MMLKQPELEGNQIVVQSAEPAPSSTVLVSVVIPAYQCSSFIGQALDSVFAQTFTNFEVIVVNDGSGDTDQLERVLEPYGARLRYIKQSNQGPGGARNAGIVAAQGKYIALLDADDYWLPDHLAKQTEVLLRDSSLALVYSDSLLLRNDELIGTRFRKEPQADTVTFETLITECCSIGTSSVVASRQALLEAGLFNPEFKRCEDYDLWVRLSHMGHRIVFSRNLQVCHRASNGLSSDLQAMRRARIATYERLLSLLQLSTPQQQLIARQLAYTKALSQLAQAKTFLLARDYRKARVAAQSANSVLQRWKLRIFVFALRTVPALSRVTYRVYKNVVIFGKKVQAARMRRRHRQTSINRDPLPRP